MANEPRARGVVASWLSEPLDALAKKQVAMMGELPDVCRLVVLPDAHAGSLLCNGTVLATASAIYPDAVGRDIGCGYTAARLACDAGAFRDTRVLESLLLRLSARVRTLRRRDGVDAVEFGPGVPLSSVRLDTEWRRITRSQLGTLGRGNHFVEFQRDADGFIWIMVHSGSRSLGEVVHAHHTARAISRERGVARLERGTPYGDAYLSDALAVQGWASANRAALLTLATEAVSEIGAATMEASSMVDSPHNTIAIERHGGDELVVHRKSAVRAREGEAVLIAGSAATFSVHAEGRGCQASLESCAHGAGRAMARSASARRFGAREVARQYGGVVFDRRLVDRLRDEAPESYRDLRPVLKAQRELARTTRRLEPLVSFKGV